jgi:hypothetical protein
VTQTAAARRPDRADLTVAVLLVVAVAVLLFLARGMTFFADEWAVIAERNLSLDDFLRPFNEHWLGVTIVLYRIWLGLFGLESYVPYQVLLVAAHVVVVVLLYLLVRRGAGPWIGVGAAAIAALFGSGFENLYWAMQVGFLISIALGFGALLLLQGRPTAARVATAVILMTIGIMTSGFGLFMGALVVLDVLLDPARRRWVPALLIPAGVYLAWYVTLGRSGVATHNDPFTIEAILQTPAFVIEGVGTAFGSAVGVGPVLGLAVAPAFVIALVVVAIRRRTVPTLAIACFLAIVVQYAILGLIRAQLFDGAAQYSRYAYLSGMVALLGIASLMGAVGLPERPPWRSAARAGIVAVVALSVVWNVWLLIAGRAIFLDRAERTRASIIVATGELPPGVDPDTAKLLDRTITTLRGALDRYGSPLEDRFVPDAPQPSPELIEEFRTLLAQGRPPQALVSD